MKNSIYIVINKYPDIVRSVPFTYILWHLFLQTGEGGESKCLLEECLFTFTMTKGS